MDEKKIHINKLEQFLEKSIGQDVLRYLVLPDILGNEKETLLYFSGRNLARNLKIDSLEDIKLIFSLLSWGNLDLIKEKKNEITFHLLSDQIVKRIQSDFITDFRLEAGFLAEAISHLTERPCECQEDVNKRLFQVEFKVIFTD